jgi:ion channel-forming bestrophin family protein
MLVFRNQTAYARFWDGRILLTTIITCCRNLTRCFVTTSYSSANIAQQPPTTTRQAERADTERTVKYLLALLVSTKNHLRGNWGGFSGISSRAPSPSRYSWPTQRGSENILPDATAFLRNRGRLPRQPAKRVAELSDLIPSGLVGYEDRGLGVPLQFTALIEGYIKRGFERGWWNAPTSSQHTAQLNTLVDAYGKMETIRLTPVPVALLIHQKQVLALFGAVLPFAMVTTTGWWAIPISALVVFTLYGIDGIASQLEDPFGYDRIDIDMDSLVEDIRTETLTLLDEWQRVGEAEGEILDDGHKQHPSSSTLVDVQEHPQANGVATEDWHRDSNMMSSATTAAASSSASAILEVKRRGEEGGEWFMPGEGLGKTMNWGNEA